MSGIRDDVLAADIERSASVLDIKTALPVKEGYLTKRGETVKSWKRRWFQLRGGQLYYYKERGDVLLGTISLNDSDVGHMDYSNKQNCFAIKTTKRIFYCIADTTVDANEWIDVIVKHGANTRLIAEGIRVTQSTRAIKMGKNGLQVTTSPQGRIKTTLRTSSRAPSAQNVAPHTFHRKFVNGVVKCSQCKGQLKQQCYLCQVCRCCIHPRCFKDTPTNCYSRDDFNGPERPVSPTIHIQISDQPRLYDPRQDRARAPSRRLPARISDRVRESGVYRLDEINQYDDSAYTEETPEMNDMEPVHRIPGAVKVGVMVNQGDLHRKLASTGASINHRGSIVSTYVPKEREQAVTAPRRGIDYDEEPEQAAFNRMPMPPPPSRNSKPKMPALRAAKSVPEGQFRAINQQQNNSPMYSDEPQEVEPDPTEAARKNTKGTQLDFLDQFEFINTPLSPREEEDPGSIVPAMRDSPRDAPISPREPISPRDAPRPKKALPPVKKSGTKVPPKKAAPPLPKKASPVLMKAVSVPEQLPNWDDPLEELSDEAPVVSVVVQPVVVPPQPSPEPTPFTLTNEQTADTRGSELTPPSTKLKARLSGPKIIPEFPAEYMTRELPPLDPSKRASARSSEKPVTYQAPDEPDPEEPTDVTDINVPEPQPTEDIPPPFVPEPQPMTVIPLQNFVPLATSSVKSPQMRPKGPNAKGPKGAPPSMGPKKVPAVRDTPPVEAVVAARSFPSPKHSLATSQTIPATSTPPPGLKKAASLTGIPKAGALPKNGPLKGKAPSPKLAPKQPPKAGTLKRSPSVETAVPVQPQVDPTPVVSSPEVAKRPSSPALVKRPAPPGSKRNLVASGSNGTAPGVKKSGEFPGMRNNVPANRGPISNEPADTPVAVDRPVVEKPLVAAKSTRTVQQVKPVEPVKPASPKTEPVVAPRPIERPRVEPPRAIEKPVVPEPVPEYTDNNYQEEYYQEEYYQEEYQEEYYYQEEYQEEYQPRPEPEPIDVPVINVPVVTDDIVVNSNTKPAVQAVRKASMTRRSADYPQTKREKAVAVAEPEPYDDWGADIDNGLREAADLIEDDFVDTFADFDNFDDWMQTLRADTSELDALLDPDESTQKYSSWVVDEVRSRKPSTTGQAKAPVRRVSIDNRKSVPAQKRESWVDEQW